MIFSMVLEKSISYVSKQQIETCKIMKNANNKQTQEFIKKLSYL